MLRCLQYLKGALRLDENASQCFAKQLSAKENYNSNSCEFHLVASGRMSIWQLVSVRRYLHCLKVDGDREENQCGCKQRNGRVMCSPGQAMQKKPCQGNTEWRLNSLVFLPALPTATFNPHTHLSSWSQSSRLSFPAASRNANSAEPPIKAPDGTVNKNVSEQD